MAEKTVAPIRVLLVDDHPVVRAGLNSMLRKQTGLRIVGTVHGGREALEFLAEEHPVLALRQRDLYVALRQHGIEEPVGAVEHRVEDVSELEEVELGDGHRVAFDGERAELTDDLAEAQVHLLGMVHVVVDEVGEARDVLVEDVEQPELRVIARLELDGRRAAHQSPIACSPIPAAW